MEQESKKSNGGGKRAMKKAGKIRLILALVLLLFALFFGYQLLQYWLENTAADQEFEDLSQLYHSQQTAEVPSVEEETNDGEAAVEEQQPEPEPNRGLFQLQQQNADTFAWLQVPGTKIDYPVMYTPGDGEYYLRRNFGKNYSISGTPFMDFRCTPESQNFILYGHNMKTGIMFADLLNYNKQSYFEQNNQIILNLPNETRFYDVIAAFPSEADPNRETFPWYNYITFTDQVTFDTFMTHLRRASLYPLPREPQYGDQFITLATCSYHDKAGRFVLIGVEAHRETNQEESVETTSDTPEE